MYCVCEPCLVNGDRQLVQACMCGYMLELLTQFIAILSRSPKACKALLTVLQS